MICVITRKHTSGRVSDGVLRTGLQWNRHRGLKQKSTNFTYHLILIQKHWKILWTSKLHKSYAPLEQPDNANQWNNFVSAVDYKMMFNALVYNIYTLEFWPDNRVRAYVGLCVCMCVCICLRARACMFACVHACVCVCASVHSGICTGVGNMLTHAKWLWATIVWWVVTIMTPPAKISRCVFVCISHCVVHVQPLKFKLIRLSFFKMANISSCLRLLADVVWFDCPCQCIAQFVQLFWGHPSVGIRFT